VQRFGAARVSVRYNRPSLRGRALFGGIVPWDSVWCPGADEGTRLVTNRPLKLAGATLPKGAYTLWMIPRRSGPWTLIFSKRSHAYHTPYPGAGHDALRIPVTPQPAAPVEALEFAFPSATPQGGELELRWGSTAVPIPFTIAQ
jgi:hypothetical protein